ncbi:hypothetical protein [Streptomyces atrovirens]|uniref:Uncharacterized protein n=1 Tax=Streptomyces atrovirens TaxID=285556 RepID=A0ABW0DXX8_9ACTN
MEQLLLAGRKHTVEIQILPLSREQDAGLAGPSCCSMLRRGAGSRASRWHPARTPCAYGTRRT